MTDIQNSGNMIVGSVSHSTIVQTVNHGQGVSASADSTVPNKPRLSLFLSYRRTASLHFAPRLAMSLRERLDDKSEVFIDVDSIQVGTFPTQINAAIARCDCFCVVVSPLTLRRAQLERPTDWIRLELLEAARLNKPILQIAEDNTAFAVAPDLPLDLAFLARYNGVRIHEDSFGRSIDHLIDKLGHL